MKAKIFISYTERTNLILKETRFPISTNIVIIHKNKFDNLKIENKHKILLNLIDWVNEELDKLN